MANKLRTFIRLKANESFSQCCLKGAAHMPKKTPYHEQLINFSAIVFVYRRVGRHPFVPHPLHAHSLAILQQ